MWKQLFHWFVYRWEYIISITNNSYSSKVKIYARLPNLDKAFRKIIAWLFSTLIIISITRFRSGYIFLAARASLCMTRCVDFAFESLVLMRAGSPTYCPNITRAPSVPTSTQFSHCMFFSAIMNKSLTFPVWDFICEIT